MALKLLTKLAAKSKIAKAGIVVSKTKTGMLESTATAKVGTTAIATTSTAKAGLIAGAAVATTTLGAETLGDGVLARTTAASIEALGDNIIPLTLTVVALYVVLIIVKEIRTQKRKAKILQDYMAKVSQDYYDAANTITYQETLGISHEEKAKLIKIIHLFLIEFVDKNVFDAENTAYFIGYIQRDCIKFSHAFLIVDRFRFMLESSSVSDKKSILKTFLKKLDEVEKSHKNGLLSDTDFQKKVENIILNSDKKSLLKENFGSVVKIATKIALFSIGLDDL
jgi:hypothetical protein